MVVRGLTVCNVFCVRDVSFCVGFAAFLTFFCCGVSARFWSVVPYRVFAESVFVGERFVATRAVSVLSANVVWDTDKPRHTVKNSIILFIPSDEC